MSSEDFVRDLRGKVEAAKRRAIGLQALADTLTGAKSLLDAGKTTARTLYNERARAAEPKTCGHDEHCCGSAQEMFPNHIVAAMRAFPALASIHLALQADAGLNALDWHLMLLLLNSFTYNELTDEINACWDEWIANATCFACIESLPPAAAIPFKHAGKAATRDFATKHLAHCLVQRLDEFARSAI